MGKQTDLEIAIEALQGILEAEDPGDMVSSAGYALGQIGAELPEGADSLGRSEYEAGQNAQ